MNIDTVRFSHILETNGLDSLTHFLAHAAFVISHKSESIETLLGVLWYLPANSPIIIVTNCPEHEYPHLQTSLKEHLLSHQHVYLVHQKDAIIAQLFKVYSVEQLLGPDGKVVNGKGEGMYIGALCAHMLDYPQWLIFYDADNFVPSALLEYTLAMGKLFMAARTPVITRESDALVFGEVLDNNPTTHLHNVRICWSSKPHLGSNNVGEKLLGRCTRVISPLLSNLIDGWFGTHDYAICSSNAGEQGMSMNTARTLRFSAGFSVETFQLLDLLYNAMHLEPHYAGVVLQQYQSKSPHFHEKKDDEHIGKMIADSLGGFLHFEHLLPSPIKRQIEHICADLHLDIAPPSMYPALQGLGIGANPDFVNRYKLTRDADSEDSFTEGGIPCGSL